MRKWVTGRLSKSKGGVCFSLLSNSLFLLPRPRALLTKPPGPLGWVSLHGPGPGLLPTAVRVSEWLVCGEEGLLCAFERYVVSSEFCQVHPLVLGDTRCRKKPHPPPCLSWLVSFSGNVGPPAFLGP